MPRSRSGLAARVLGLTLLGLLGQASVRADVPSLQRQGDKLSIPADSPLRSRLGLAAAETRTVGAKLTLPAIVEADPARSILVLPPLGGRVLHLPVGLGDRVRKGQVLAVIDSPDLAQAYDDNDKAADLLQLAEKNFSRQQAQHRISAISDRDLDQSASDLAQARAERLRTQARLRLLQADPAATTRHLTIRAASDGSITSLSTAPGAMINDPTQPIMTLADLSQLWVTAMVPERDLSQVTLNESAEVSLAAYPGEILHGTVAMISDVLEPDSRRNKVRILFANPHHALKPNMFATVLLQGPQSAQVVVPSSALLMNNDRVTLFVETAPWVFERRVVEVDLQEADSVTVKRGLKAGETVVVRGAVLLND